jgi:hypothetical protein
MYIRAVLAGTIALAAVSFVAEGAIAKTVPIDNWPQKLGNSCTGTLFKNQQKGVTACLFGDGSIMVCGGVTAQQKNTCYAGRVSPGERGLIRQFFNRLSAARP